MKESSRNTMLENWRPPSFAGDPIGCLASTFTFDPGFFEEECLPRFLNIDSHPDHEGIAFLLERENQLGSVYTGVLVDHSMAGVDHSLRWDILPVHIQGHFQHSKISVLAWSNYIRIIVASANLTPTGYRHSQEVAGFFEFSPDKSDHSQIEACCSFLENLLNYVPRLGPEDSVLTRAKDFTQSILKCVTGWKQPMGRKQALKQYFIFTYPKHVEKSEANEAEAYGSLNSAIDICMKHGGAPSSVGLASPFFNQTRNTARDEVTAQLCKRMARGTKRTLTFCIPELSGNETEMVRLAAPEAIYKTAVKMVDRVKVETLPHCDNDKNIRPWHAKMLWMSNTKYTALMIGSSNFTNAGMGLSNTNNAEANILYVAQNICYGRNKTALEQCIPETVNVDDVENIEWTGEEYPIEEADDNQTIAKLPPGFVAARYHAGKKPHIKFRLKKENLPKSWTIFCGQDNTVKFFDASDHKDRGHEEIIDIDWTINTLPCKLFVKWEEDQTFWPVNIEDTGMLPLPKEIRDMTAHDLMDILSAFDYGTAFRAWARKNRGKSLDDDLDSAIPAEIDPLKRFNLQDTFLHRVRRRSRILADIRKNLERPCWSEKSLEWRLKGILGVETLVNKLCNELKNDLSNQIETILKIADTFMVLSETNYQETPGSISRRQFNKKYKTFLQELSVTARDKIKKHTKSIPLDIQRFWSKVYRLCQN